MAIGGSGTLVPGISVPGSLGLIKSPRSNAEVWVDKHRQTNRNRHFWVLEGNGKLGSRKIFLISISLLKKIDNEIAFLALCQASKVLEVCANCTTNRHLVI